MTIAPGRGGQVGRRGRASGSTGRRGRPGPCRSAASEKNAQPTSPQEHDRRTDQADDGVDLAAALEPRGVLGRRGGVDLRMRGEERPVEVGRRGGAAACRSRRSPGARCWSGRRPRSPAPRRAGPGRARGSGRCRRRSTRPSSKPLRPTPHWSISARAWPRSPRSSARSRRLGVDDDLGAGPRLDRVDRRLGRRRSSRARRCRRVVDGLAVAGSGNGGPAVRAAVGRTERCRAERKRDAASAARTRSATSGEPTGTRHVAQHTGGGQPRSAMRPRRRPSAERAVRRRGGPAAAAAGRCRSTPSDAAYAPASRIATRSPRRSGGRSCVPSASVDSQIGPSTRAGDRSRAGARSATAVDGPPERGQRDDRVAGAVQRRPDQLGHAGVEDDLAPAAVADVEDARDQPARPGDEEPAGLDREAGRAPVVGDRLEQRPAARARSARARVPARRAGRPGTRRRRRACRTCRSSRATGAASASAAPDRVAPRVDRAELRPDVEVDAARPKRGRPGRRRPSIAAGDLGLGHAELRAARADGQAGQRLGRDVGVEPVAGRRAAVGRRRRPRVRSAQRLGLLRRLERDPPERPSRRPRRATAARRSASVLPIPSSVIRSFGTPGAARDRPLAARDDVRPEARAPRPRR